MTERSKAKRKLWGVPRAKFRSTAAGFKHDWDPCLIGIAAGDFLPADPAVWFDAAVHAGLEFARGDDRLVWQLQPDDNGAGAFLIGWLRGTQGGEDAVLAWMRAQGIRGVVRGELMTVDKQ